MSTTVNPQDLTLSTATLSSAIQALRRVLDNGTHEESEKEAIFLLLSWLDKLNVKSEEDSADNCIYFHSYRRKFSRSPTAKVSFDDVHPDKVDTPRKVATPRKDIEIAGNEALQRQLQVIESWNDFDIFEVAEHSSGAPLQVVGLALLQQYDLIQKLQLPIDKVKSFLRDLERLYNRNPYHNNIHAADVTQTVGSVLALDSLSTYLSDLELLAIIFSALIHDVNHPGVANEFHVNTKSDASLLYNDQSINENHHLATAFRILHQHGNNFVENLTTLQYKFFRATVIRIVLATDMAGHKDLLTEFGQTVKLYGGNLTNWPTDKRLLLLQTLVHVSDIGNPAKPLHLSLRWTDRVMEEFFNQGDKERNLGLQVSPLCDRQVVEAPRSQQAFLQYVVKPSFELLTAVAPKTSALAMENIKEALHHWQALIDNNKE